ncbi:hypothetical protein [Nonlabens xiamenensis]|uniref:hypothetical protein n=1 Tax=Nonlabens xiamenensis TaxID=2341043 RepID=UPI000F61106E|nr:hypothetical protein [Nonlabens xiamenensis]
MDHQPEKQQEQEVDLVPVFVWIGNGFKNLFNAIGNALKGIGHFLILFLIFIKKNLMLLSLFFIVGAALGFYLRQESKKIFTAKMRVQPNFESAGQLISNINYYNSLLDQGDYERLSNQLEIPEQVVSQLKSVEIEADFNDTELLEEYDELARKSDTMALENFTFEGFKAAKRNIDYQYYHVIVSATDRQVLQEYAPKLVEIEENSKIMAERLAARESSQFNIEKLEYQLQELDSLISSYQEAIRKSDNKDDGGNNIYLNNKDQNSVFRDVFYQKANLLKMLKEERLEKYSYDKTVNMVSFLVTKGTLEKQHLTVKFAFAFLGLGLLVALIPLLWRFLNDYEKKV